MHPPRYRPPYFQLEHQTYYKNSTTSPKPSRNNLAASSPILVDRQADIQ